MAAGNGDPQPVRFLHRLRFGILRPLWRAEARLRGVECAGGVQFNGRPCLARCRGSRIVLGAGVVLNSALRSNPLGSPRPVTLRTMQLGAEIRFERESGISNATICAAARIHVGEGTIIGTEAMLFDSDFHAPVSEWGWGLAAPDNPRPITIGRGVFIGARALVLKGVCIGDRAIIGAGAVVTKDVPAGHVAVGNPARILPPKEHPAGT